MQEIEKTFKEKVLPFLVGKGNKDEVDWIGQISHTNDYKVMIRTYFDLCRSEDIDKDWKKKNAYDKAICFSVQLLNNPSLPVKMNYIQNIFNIDKHLDKVKITDKEMRENLRAVALSVAMDFAHSKKLLMSYEPTDILRQDSYQQTKNNNTNIKVIALMPFLYKPLEQSKKDWGYQVLFGLNYNPKNVPSKIDVPFYFTYQMACHGFDKNKFKDVLLNNESEFKNFAKLLKKNAGDWVNNYPRDEAKDDEKNNREKVLFITSHFEKNSYHHIRDVVLDIAKSPKAKEFFSKFDENVVQVLKMVYFQNNFKDSSSTCVEDFKEFKRTVGLNDEVSFKDKLILLMRDMGKPILDEIIKEMSDCTDSSVILKKEKQFNKELNYIKFENALEIFVETYGNENDGVKRLNSFALKKIEKHFFGMSNPTYMESECKKLLKILDCDEFYNIFMASSACGIPADFNNVVGVVAEKNPDLVIKFLDNFSKAKACALKNTSALLKINNEGAEFYNVAPLTRVRLEVINKFLLDLTMSKIQEPKNNHNNETYVDISFKI